MSPPALEALNKSNIMAIGKCLKCDVISQMTEDHIIPKWFRKMLPEFGIKIPAQNEIQMVCQKCNSTKGGKLDYSHSTTRDFMKKITTDIVVEIRKHETFNL
jgi:hypothetical protein